MSGCSKKLKSVLPDELEATLEKKISNGGARDISSSALEQPVKLADYPLLREVCSAKFDSASYQFEGDKLRFKLNRYAYKMPVEGYKNSQVYRHEYAVCFDFWPTNSTVPVQEAVYVQYLAAKSSDYLLLVPAILSTQGGYQGLLADSGFHNGVTVADNAWSKIERKTYEEADRVYFLKMEVLNMKVLNSYNAEKYDDVLAFEFVHANVTSATGTLQFANVRTAIQQEVFSKFTTK